MTRREQNKERNSFFSVLIKLKFEKKGEANFELIRLNLCENFFFVCIFFCDL
jgi:hypothetical protein